MKKNRFFLFLAPFVWVACGQETSQEKREMNSEIPFEGLKVVLIGDSISEGMLAHTHLNSLESLKEVKKYFFEIYDFQTKTVQKEKAIEKFSRPELSTFHEKNKESWALSSLWKSHLSQELQWKSPFVRTGAEFKDMTLKLKTLEAKENIDVLMIQLASNDFCNKDLTPDQFSKNIEEFLKMASLKYEFKHLLYAGFPPIPELFHNPKFSPDRLKDSLLNSIGFKISDYRLGLCPIMKDLPLENAQKRWNDFEIILKGHFQESSQSHFVSLNHLNLEPEDMALDGFHPSSKGQEKIGRIVLEKLLEIKLD